MGIDLEVKVIKVVYNITDVFVNMCQLMQEAEKFTLQLYFRYIFNSVTT